MMNGIQQLEQTANGPYFNVANAFPETSQARPQGNKRKSEDKDNTADGNQGRAKRNRYIRSVLSCLLLDCSSHHDLALRRLPPVAYPQADC